MDIPISSILLDNRQRIDHSNTDGLESSLKQFGTIQPLVLEEITSPAEDSPYRYRLVAGGRRLHFLKRLGHETLFRGSTYNPNAPGYVLGRELSRDEYHELELEENIRRKEMTWQERALAIANLHRLKILRDPSWGQRQTGELLGIALGKVNYALQIAGELSKPDSPLWKLDGPLEAVRWFDQQKEQRVMEELQRRQAKASAQLGDRDLDVILSLPDEPPPSADEDKIIAKERYDSNPLNDPDGFEAYWAERQHIATLPPKVYVTPRLIHGSCLDWMKEHPSYVDHIITDPPYGIDMDMLEQENQGMSNIDSVRKEHDEDENLDLLTKFFPLAYSTLKDSGFLVLWADYMRWQFLYDNAIAAGFKVQRWPLVWVKTHTVKNSAAQYNFTKTTEIALVCRKGNATLINAGPPGHIIAGHDDFKKTMSHPFVKPFEAWAHIITNVSIQGQLIYEPFAGEGSGIISALRLNRNYVATELSDHHYPRLLENVKSHYRSLNDKTLFV